MDIGAVGQNENVLSVSAHAPAGGQRLDRPRTFLSELEARHPGACVVRVTLNSAWRAGVEPAPEPLRFHWQIEVVRAA